MIGPVSTHDRGSAQSSPSAQVVDFLEQHIGERETNAERSSSHYRTVQDRTEQEKRGGEDAAPPRWVADVAAVWVEFLGHQPADVIQRELGSIVERHGAPKMLRAVRAYVKACDPSHTDHRLADEPSFANPKQFAAKSALWLKKSAPYEPKGAPRPEPVA